jgi:CheY-like chemotaxis protein
VSLKILLADDSMTAQNMGKKILTDAGYDVMAVSNGAAAMKKIAAGQFDLLLLDVNMPGYTGPEVCAKARDLKNYAKTPILFIIGKMELGTFKIEDAPKLKADGVIVKPFEATDLVTTIRTMTAGLSSAKPPKPSVPPEAEKTMRITPITEDTDQSFAQWSATAERHKEDGQEEEAPSAAPMEMSSAAAATAAFDEVSAAPAFDVAPASPPAFDLSPSAYDPAPMDSAPADLGLGGLGGPLTMESPATIELEPAAPLPPSSPTVAFELETTPEQVEVGPVAPAPGLEHTAAAPVQIHVETAPELEVHSMDDRTPVAADPNFLSDRTTMVDDFATKFTSAGEDISVGIVGAEAPVEAAANTALDIPARPAETETPSSALEIPTHDGPAEETSKLTPWVTDEAPVFSQTPAKIVSFAPPEQLAEFLATPVDAPPPEDTVVIAPPEPVAEPVVEPAPSAMAQELEQAIVTLPEPAAVVEAPLPPPATLEASLEQSIQPEPTVTTLIEPEPEAAPAEAAPKKPAGDLEFAQALEAAIATAPVAVAEAHPAEADHLQAHAAAASAAGATPAAELAASAGISGLAGVDPQIIHRAVERVLANAKQDIIAEILKELNNK